VIPLVDLKAQYRALKPEIDQAIQRVLDNAQFILGPAVSSFEQDFAAFCHSADAIGVNSGTSALHLALLAAGVRPGDEVITVPFTFVATVAAIEYAQARPVFVDIEPTYFTMDPAKIERAVTPRTKAIVPVHLYGQPADMDAIRDVADRHRLIVIEDACQSHGSEYKGRRCGSMGLLGCFSFYPGKNLGAYGEGGAIVTSDPALATKVRLLRSWGEEVRYEHKHRGFNYRMDGVQGAVLGSKPCRRIYAPAHRNSGQRADGTACVATCLPPVRRARSRARRVAGRLDRSRSADRSSLSDSRASSACLCGPRLLER
jgi:dTDP-4-amino-4,6-dideoxygalactose transaminase